MQEQTTSRTARISALYRLAAIAGQGEAMPLPDAINMTVPTRAALDAIAADFTAAAVEFERRGGNHVQELIVSRPGLVYRVRYHGPALPSVQAAAEQEASA